MPFHGSMDAQLICQSFDSSLPSGLASVAPWWITVRGILNQLW